MRRWNWLAIVLLTPVACLIAPVVLYFCPIGWSRPFRQAAFDGVVDRIQSSNLRPDSHGVVTLPGRQASLSATGRVYVRRWPNGRLIVFIPTWVGRHTLLISELDVSGDNWLQGYVYDSMPQSRKHTGAKVTADDYPFILGPPRNPPWRAAHEGRAELRNDLIRTSYGQIDEHWCYVDIFS